MPKPDLTLTAEQEAWLDESNPSFLVLLDSDPHRAESEFTQYMHLLFHVRLGKLQCFGLTEDQFEGFYNRFLDYCCGRRGKRAVHSCRVNPRCVAECGHHFCLLRQYSDIGKPLASFLVITAKRKTIDWIHRQPGEVPLEEFEGWEPRAPETESFVDPAVVECLSAAGSNCKQLLTLRAGGYKPADIARLIPHYEHVPRKELYADIAACKEQVRICLQQRGITQGDLR